MKVAVIGSGTMGTGIGQVFAQHGYEVYQVDFYTAQLEKSRDIMTKSLSKLHSKGLVDKTPEEILKSVTFTDNISQIRDADMVMEAVFEKLETKSDVLSRISDTVNDKAIIGSNTSSISINKLSKFVKNPERFLGVHFFNPVPIMKLVELVTSEKTDPSKLSDVKKILIGLGKDPVTSQDYPGFISNRILMPLIREAILVFEEHVSNAEDIDKTFRLGMNHPMGPLELADFIGLDVCQDIMEVLYTEYGDPRYKPPIALRNLVLSGKLGRKSGSGFYDYEVKK